MGVSVSTTSTGMDEFIKISSRSSSGVENAPPEETVFWLLQDKNRKAALGYTEVAKEVNNTVQGFSNDANCFSVCVIRKCGPIFKVPTRG